MARPLTPQSVNAIAGFLGIIVVLAIASYFYFVMAKVPAQAPAAQNYNLSVISNDLNKTPASSNVFLETKNLTDPTGGNSGQNAASYTSDEIGKTDLTQLDQ